MFKRKQRPASQQPPPAAAPAQQAPSQNHGHHSSNSYAQQSTGYPHQQNGYHSHGPPPAVKPYGAPPGADPRLWQYFSNVDTDRSGSIDVHELRRALVNSNWSQFDLDTIKMLMNIFDTDRSGTIGFNEFVGLYKYIEDWQGVFRHWDSDQSGSIEERELAGALSGFGYNLNPHLIRLVLNKYSTTPLGGYGSPPPSINFDRFLRACVSVKQLTDAFRAADRDNDGWVQLNYDQLMEIFLRAP